MFNLLTSKVFYFNFVAKSLIAAILTFCFNWREVKFIFLLSFSINKLSILSRGLLISNLDKLLFFYDFFLSINVGKIIFFPINYSSVNTENLLLLLSVGLINLIPVSFFKTVCGVGEDSTRIRLTVLSTLLFFTYLFLVSNDTFNDFFY